MSDYNDVFGTATIPPAEYRFSSITIAENDTKQLVWPSNYSAEVVDTTAAPALLHVSGGLGSELRLPPANEASVGQDLLVYNTGTHPVTIVDVEDTPITTLVAGTAKYLYITDNSDPAGVWGVFTYGTGTSGADASLLAGNGLQAVSNKLHATVSYRAVNSGVTLSESDRATLVDAQSGGITVTLPSTLTSGFFVYLRNSSTGNVTLQPSGGQTVDGDVSLVLSPGESAQVLYTGGTAYWETVGYGRDATFIFSEVVIDASAGSVSLTSGQLSGKMVRITGTATANITVTLPSVDNILFVSTGAGLGSYSATFTTGGGSTVILPANQRTVLYCDGTNVSTAVTTTVASDLALDDGGAAAPTLYFALDPDTGFYRSGSGSVSFTSNGVEKVRFTSGGLVLGASAAYTLYTPTGGSLTGANVQVVLEDVEGELLNLSNGKQPLDATLTALAGVTVAADKLIYATGADTFATTDITAFGRSLLDDADAAAMRATLGLGSMAVQAANGVSISGGSIAGITDLAVADGGTGASTAADARSNLGVPAAISDAIDEIFAGSVAYFAASTAPTGWLKANGTTVSRTTYARLFSRIGTTFGAGDGATTFNLPDLRGEFVRGLDDGRGVDAGRALGSAQADEFKLHGHPFITGVGGGEEASGGLNLEISSNVSHPAFSGTPTSTRGQQLGGSGGTETRPRNVALLACIKY